MVLTYFKWKFLILDQNKILFLQWANYLQIRKIQPNQKMNFTHLLMLLVNKFKISKNFIDISNKYFV